MGGHCGKCGVCGYAPQVGLSDEENEEFSLFHCLIISLVVLVEEKNWWLEEI